MLQQLLSGPTGLQQFLSGQGGLEELLSVLAPAQQAISGLAVLKTTIGAPVPAVDQNVVDQTSYQLQVGAPGASAQTQAASQANVTVQVGLVLGLGSAVNEVVQDIWQLQVGCIFYCVGTQQIQQASESDTLIDAVTAGGGSPTVVVNSAVLRIWQLQVGCLFWCYATVQLQSASISERTSTASVGVPASAPGSGDTPPTGDSEGVGAATGATVGSGGSGVVPTSDALISPPAGMGLTPPPDPSNEIDSPSEPLRRIRSGTLRRSIAPHPSLVRIFVVEAAGPAPPDAAGRSRDAGLGLYVDRSDRRAEPPSPPRPERGAVAPERRDGSAGRLSRHFPSVIVLSPRVSTRSPGADGDASEADGDASPSQWLVVVAAAALAFLIGSLISLLLSRRPGI
jgi:hypothetical protein